MPPEARHDLGQTGEKLAEVFLRQRGYRTAARHFTTPVGELDLVMQAGATIVFVEVKTRRDRRFADPEDAVDGRKQARLLRAARWFLAQRGLHDRPCRFDVVTVILAPPAEPEIAHHVDAFPPA
jgi:putative endonuclease